MTTNSTSPSTEAGPPAPRWVIKAMTRVHVSLNRLTGGRLFNSLAGDDVCFVTMKGAKSGRTLTIPLMYVPYRTACSWSPRWAAHRGTPSGTTTSSSIPRSR